MDSYKKPPMGHYKGIPAAPGLASGPVVIWDTDELSFPRKTGHDPAVERKRLQDARAEAKIEISSLEAKIGVTIKTGETNIFMAHRMFVDDVALLKKVEQLLLTGLNAEACWMDAIESFALLLDGLPDLTLKARAADIRDVGRRVLSHLLDVPVFDFHLESPMVIIASDLTPSQTANLNNHLVLAFCLEKGGPTSHTAILAKALGIPAVVGLGSTISSINPGSIVLVDGDQGRIIIDPDGETMDAFQALSTKTRISNLEAQESAALPAATTDGVQIEVVANIGSLEDAQAATKFGAEGVGLFRTEFLYLNRQQLPEEAEQVKVYRKVFDALGDKPIVVRTLDIGGDKAVPYLGFSQEANPFLGWRAIRMNDTRPDVFLSQVRALLQAGYEKDLRIMIPMVSNSEEITHARRLVDQASMQLQKEGLSHAQNVQFGIMVEIPSTALIADRLASSLDFFSIGTNDLTQYTLAADRTNARVANLASPFHPAVIQLIQMTIHAAHANHKWVGMCGEMAGDVLAVPLLLGLGLDEFSMAPALIPTIKQAIRKCEQNECRRLAKRILKLTSTSEVITMLTAEADRLQLV